MSSSGSAMAAAADSDDDWVDVAEEEEEFCGHWVDVAEGEEFCGPDPEEWVVLVGDEGSMAAVFFGRAAAGIGPVAAAAPIPIVGPADAAAGCRGRVLLCGPGAAPLPGSDDAIAASPGRVLLSGQFPSPDDAVAASRGRVLLSGPWSRYYVFDPAAGARHSLPVPGRAGPRDAAITCDADASGRYWVVCAFADGFEVYASSTGEWREVRHAGASALAPGSAAGFDGWVFWKRAAFPGVLALHAASGIPREIGRPPHCSGPEAVWQLGVAAGHLCAAVAVLTRDGIELYRCVFRTGAAPVWKRARGTYGLGMRKNDVRLLRFESDGYEVLLRVGTDRVVAVALDIDGRISRREARLDGAVLPEEDEKIVPWCRPAS